MSVAARPFYYLENFYEALGWLRGRYADLLLAEELRFIDALHELPRASAGLLVRMILRRGELFRRSGLRYEEIGATEDALPALIDLSWIDPEPPLTLLQLCALLRRDELQRALSLRRRPRCASSATRQLDLDFRHEESRPLEGWWRNAPDQVLHVRVAGLCHRLRHMFFGNFHQDWSAFVLCDLGIRRYEAVSLQSDARAFQTREQIEQFERLFELRARLQDDVPAVEVLRAMPDLLAGCDWIEARRSKLLYRIGQRCEKACDLQGALSAYSSCDLPEARIRAIRVLERAGHTAEAAERLRTAESLSASELERQHAARMRPRLMRKLGLPAEPVKDCASTWSTFDLELACPERSRSVEHLVKAHLQANDTRVAYVESTLINALFGLLFWSALFAPVPGAFFHPFQAAPIDLLEPGFAARRAAEIDACFDELESGRYRNTILAHLEQKAGITCPLIAWKRVAPELVRWALDCVPAIHLRALFSRLLADLRTHRAGLPDLIQFWPGERRYRMVEVKGPGDRLQDNQIRWLRFCADNDIPAEVCVVRWMS